MASQDRETPGLTYLSRISRTDNKEMWNGAQRSQVLKSSGGTLFSNEVQNVQSAGTNADPIFVGYTALGSAVTSANMTTSAGQQALATIKTIQFRMKVKAAIVDPQTGLAPETTLGGQIAIGNCSLAATIAW